jgi:hypothetical protein
MYLNFHKQIDNFISISDDNTLRRSEKRKRSNDELN